MTTQPPAPEPRPVCARIGGHLNTQGCCDYCGAVSLTRSERRAERVRQIMDVRTT